MAVLTEAEQNNSVKANALRAEVFSFVSSRFLCIGLNS